MIDPWFETMAQVQSQVGSRSTTFGNVDRLNESMKYDQSHAVDHLCFGALDHYLRSSFLSVQKAYED